MDETGKQQNEGTRRNEMAAAVVGQDTRSLSDRRSWGSGHSAGLERNEHMREYALAVSWIVMVAAGVRCI